MNQYKLAKGWAIFMYIGSPLLIALSGWMLLLPFLPGEDVPIGAFWFLAPLSLVMIAIIVLGLVDAITGRFVIEKDHIYTRNMFNNRLLLFTEIKGFRIDDKYIFVEPSVPYKKRIKISTYYGKSDEIRNWLYENFSDLDLMNMIEETREIFENVEFGANQEEREKRLNRARRNSTVLNVVAVAVSVWALFYPSPYGIVLITLLTIPVLAILLLKVSGGIIRLDTTNASAYPTVVYSIAIPACILVMRALVDYNLLEYTTNVWLPSVLLTMLALVLSLIGNQEFTFVKKSEYVTILGVAVFFFCHSLGSVIFLNCYFDQSDAKIFYAKVVSKHISSGKRTSYYVELAPWDKQKKSEEISVTSDLYDALNEGETATIYLRPGEFDIPWIEVEK